MDYRALNKDTIKYRYHIPIVEDLFDELKGAAMFSQLDFRFGCYQIKIKTEYRDKTAFQIHSMHYEFLVMPFGLTNALATFLNAMNMILKNHSRKFVLVFFYDILVYSKDCEEHIEHLGAVFEILKAHKYFLKRIKCSFSSIKIEYLGHFITAKGVSTYPKKIKVIVERPTPESVKQLRSFLSRAKYYRRFVRHYGIIAKHLTNLLKKGGFEWIKAANKAFQQLKEAPDRLLS